MILSCQQFKEGEKMKLNPNFLTHTTNGENYMIPTAEAKFKGMVKSNETAAFIIECLKNDTTEDEIVDKLLTEFSGADRETVKRDVSRVIEQLKGIGAIE